MSVVTRRVKSYIGALFHPHVTVQRKMASEHNTIIRNLYTVAVRIFETNIRQQLHKYHDCWQRHEYFPLLLEEIATATIHYWVFSSVSLTTTRRWTYLACGAC